MTGEATTDLRLTPADPVATYRVDWSIDLGALQPMDAVLGAAVYADRVRAEDIEVVLLQDGAAMPEVGLSGAGATLATEDCAPTCSGAARIVVHAPPDAFDGDRPIEASLEAWALTAFPSDSDTSGSLVGVDLAPDDGFAVAPSVATAAAEGALAVKSDRPGVVQFVVRVSPEALPGPPAWPMVGRLEVTTRLPVPAPDSRYMAELRGLPDEAWVQDRESTSVDLLAGCPERGVCDIPLELVVEAFPGENGELAELDLTWEVDVRLEAFDGRELPDDAVRIEVR